METDVMRRLQSLHLHAKEDWLSSAVSYCKTNNSQMSLEDLVSMIFELFLYSDLAQCYVPQMTIPSAAMKLCLVKPLIFQIVGCIDVSTSIYQQNLDKTRTEDNLNWFHGDSNDGVADNEVDQNMKRKRLLKLKLSNGKQTVHAMECGVLTLPDDDILPGTKLLLTGRTLCRRGILLLNDSNCQFIGGEVASLYSSFTGLSARVKALGIAAEKKCVPANPLPRSVIQARVSNGSTLSPFLVRMNGTDSDKISDAPVPKFMPNPTQVKSEKNASFVAPTVIHTGAPVGFVHPLPTRTFPKVVDASAVQSKPVVRVTANHRVIPDSSQNQSKTAINPMIARLCGDPRKQEDNVSSQLKAIHRLTSQRSQCPTTTLYSENRPTNTASRQLGSVADAFSSLNKEVEILKDEVKSQANTTFVRNLWNTNIDIPVSLHNKVMPHMANKSTTSKRIPSVKQDQTQKSISSYFNVVQPRQSNSSKDIESDSRDNRKKTAAITEVKVVTLSQMGSDDDEDDQLSDECFTVDIVIPNGNQRRQNNTIVKSTAINSGSRVDTFLTSHEEPPESGSHDALAEDMFVPEHLSPFQTPCSSSRYDADDIPFPTTSDLVKLSEGGISINPATEAVQRTRDHEDQHDPVKKKRTSYSGDSGRIFEELCMTPANNRVAFDVTLQTQTNFVSPKAQLITGRSIIEQFKAMGVMHLADVIRRKPFWMLPRMIYIQGICKVTSELKAYAGGWKLSVLLSDWSLHDVSCEISPQLLEKMLGFSVQSCKSLTMTIDSVEIARRKKRANLVLKSLHRLDLLLKVEFSPDAQLPVVFEVSTLSEALQVS